MFPLHKEKKERKGHAKRLLYICRKEFPFCVCRLFRCWALTGDPFHKLGSPHSARMHSPNALHFTISLVLSFALSLMNRTPVSLFVCVCDHFTSQNPEVSRYYFKKRTSSHDRNGKDGTNGESRIEPWSPFSRQRLITSATPTYHTGEHTATHPFVMQSS
jgi:hypothetical protein